MCLKHPSLLHNEDKFLVLACDGIWDVLSDEEELFQVMGAIRSACVSLHDNSKHCMDVSRNHLPQAISVCSEHKTADLAAHALVRFTTQSKESGCFQK